MKTRIIEAASPAGNHGKFLLGRMDVEWAVRTGLYEVARTVTDGVLGPGSWSEPGHSPGPLLRQLGWGPEFLWVLDLQTGEGAFFRPGGLARYDLGKHAIWVCPLFEPFLEWLYAQDLSDLDALPACVVLEHPLELAGYRRPGLREQALRDAFDAGMARGCWMERVNDEAEPPDEDTYVMSALPQ